MDMKIKHYKNFVFFDTETTGFDAINNRIIELAAIAVDENDNIVSMDEFIKLPEGESIPENIVELTHITDEMLKNEGKEELEVVKMFFNLIKKEDTLLIAHNAQFDLNFVGYTFARYRDKFPVLMYAFNHADYLDTLTIFKDRRAYPHKLENAIEAYNLTDKVQNSHRAVDDCLALYEVTKAMIEERDDLGEYINIFGYNPKYGVSNSKLKKVRYGRQSYVNKMVRPENIFPYSLELEFL